MRGHGNSRPAVWPCVLFLAACMAAGYYSGWRYAPAAWVVGAVVVTEVYVRLVTRKEELKS